MSFVLGPLPSSLFPHPLARTTVFLQEPVQHFDMFPHFLLVARVIEKIGRVIEHLKADAGIVLLSGAVTVAGHQWSPFLRFRGGLAEFLR